MTFDLSVNVVGGHEVCSGGYSGPKAELSSGVEDGFAPLRTQTYTVTGFYELPNWSLRTSYGLAAVTTGDPDASGSTRLFAVLANPESEGQIRDVMAEDTDVVLHYGLLRYQGVFDDRQIWDSFGTMAVVLAVVIVLACVSLIYNAFGISVAQRKRQFGLLASVGASKRQIRASVFFEAGVMALAGIPLGIVVGLAGTAAVLSWLAPMIERVLAYDVPFTMHVAPAVIVAVALLTLLTVVLSAWVPAVRAGRATAMEAIRASRDVRAADSRNEARLQAKHAGRSADVSLSGSKGILEPKGLSFSRLFGVPGEIARLNRKRGRGKGSAASASLAIAVVLLMTAGSFSTYMRMTTDMIGSGAIDYDIGLYSGAGENLNHVANAYDELSSLGGVTGRGWFASSSFVFRVPDSMASDSMGDVAFSEVADRTDGGYLCMGAVTVVEDAAFDEYASQCGVDPAVFEEGQFKGIAVRNSVERGGERYRVAQLLDAPGTLGAAYGGAQEGFLTFTYDSSELVAFVEQGSESDRPGSESAGDGVSMIPFNEVSTLETQLEVVALADSDAPIMGGTVPYELTVIVPMRAVAHTALLESPAFFSTPSFTACFNAEDHAQAAIDIAEAGKRIMGVEVGVSDYKATEDDGRIMMLIVDVFTMLFTGILTLIAIANVFNTLTNSLILRRREFAVMRSVGMGNAQFRKMIACECLGYGVRGLVPGLIISVGVSGLLFICRSRVFRSSCPGAIWLWRRRLSVRPWRSALHTACIAAAWTAWWKHCAKTRSRPLDLMRRGARLQVGRAERLSAFERRSGLISA